MKKIYITFLFIIVFISIVGCTNESTSITTPNSTNDSQTTEFTSMFTTSEQSQTDLYDLYYYGDDYEIFKLKNLPTETTDNSIDLGVYKGYTYYLISRTYLDYYVVIKDTEQKNLLEALETNWFELKELVDNFNIPSNELGFEPYLDEELLQAVQNVKESLSGENIGLLLEQNLCDIRLLGMSINTINEEVEELNIIPFQIDQEWVDVQVKYYTLLEEIVLNGYEQGIYTDLKDYLNDPENLAKYGLVQNQEYEIIIELDEQTLYSNIVTYSSTDLTEKLYGETVYANINIDNNLHLEKYVYSYIADYIGVDIYEENEGIYQISIEDNQVTFISGTLGGIVDNNAKLRLYQIIRNNIYELNDIQINFYNQNEEIYLSMQLINNQNIVSSIEFINNSISKTVLTQEEISTLLYAYNYYNYQEEHETYDILLYNRENQLTTGLTFRIDADRISTLIEDVNILKDYVNEYENYYAKPNYPTELLNSLKNIEIEGNYFNVLNENGEIDFSVLGNYRELYNVITNDSVSNINSYKQYLLEYNNATSSESKEGALRGLYRSIYSLQTIINWDNVLLQYFVGDTLMFSTIDFEITVLYNYNTGVLPGDINNDLESISNTASYYYQYIQENYDSIFYRFNDFGVYDYNDDLLIEYITDRAIPK